MVAQPRQGGLPHVLRHRQSRVPREGGGSGRQQLQEDVEAGVGGGGRPCLHRQDVEARTQRGARADDGVRRAGGATVLRAAGVERRAVEEDAHRLAREDSQLEPVARRRRILERQPRQQLRLLRLLRLLRHGGPRGPVRVVEGGLGPVGRRGVGGEEAAGGGERGGRDGEGGGERVAEGGYGGDGQRVEADAAVVREEEDGESGVGGQGPRHVLR